MTLEEDWDEPRVGHWGECPECGAPQEDAEQIGFADKGILYQCPCGFIYSNDDARPDSTKS